MLVVNFGFCLYSIKEECIYSEKLVVKYKGQIFCMCGNYVECDEQKCEYQCKYIKLPYDLKKKFICLALKNHFWVNAQRLETGKLCPLCVLNKKYII